MPVDKDELIREIDKVLKPFVYSPEEQHRIPYAYHVTYIKNKHPLKVRNLCALIYVPEEITDDQQAKSQFKFIRSSLLHRYGDAFLWKELEIIFVVLCHESNFAMLKKNNGIAVDQVGLTLNSMLGAFFINIETFEYFYHSVLGVYFSGAHFKAINAYLSNWCEKYK